MAKVTSTLGILTTAAAGAALMYLFDPEKGEQRREKLSGVATDALGAAGAYAGDSWASMSEKVKDIASDLGDRASDMAGDAGNIDLQKHVGKLASYASMIGSKLSDRAGSYRDAASDMADGASDTAASYLHREKHGIGTAAAIGAGGIGMLVLGAGLVYFLDPDHGEERRNGALSCANKAMGDVGEFASKTGRYVRDRVSGVSSKAQDMASSFSERASDMVENVKGRLSGDQDSGNQDTSLIDLVRSQLSDLAPGATGLTINASEGKLTLSGSVPSGDYDRIVETVRSIPGVKEFDNQLQTAGG